VVKHVTHGGLEKATWRTASVLLGVIVTVLVANGCARGAAPAPQTSRVLGLTSRDLQLDFSLVLRFDRPGLRRYFAAINDPASKLYRRYLEPAEIGRRFGLAPRAVRRIVDRLSDAGLHVFETYPQGTSIRAGGSVAAIEDFFHVSYRDFVTPGGVRYHAPLAQPRIPNGLRDLVDGVVGLSTEPHVRPADVRGGALEPIDAQIAYNVLPLHRLGVQGQGQTIAIASLSTFPRSGADDLARFDNRFGIVGPPPHAIPVGRGTADVSFELSLDIDVVRGIAPEAQIVVYEAPNSDEGVIAMFEAIAANDQGIRVVTYSWGECDDALKPAYRSGVETALLSAATAGINIFVASGDTGAYDCQSSEFANHDLTVGFPADSPSVISVGGTLLSVRENGRYLEEVGWEDSLSNGGSGGGISPVAKRPWWQIAARAAESGRGRRGVPDVAAAASPASPWWVADAGSWETSGGTSAAAPFWASSMLLVQQYAAGEGVRGLCFAAPMLYDLARANARSDSFHDVTLGGNRYYDATPGWDYPTGLGSPNVYNLARAVTTYLRSHGGQRAACAARGVALHGTASYRTFRTPSANIGCTYLERSSYTPAGLRCDILSGLHPRPLGPCDLDWTGFAVEPSGRASPQCAGDTAYDGSAAVLGYGRRWAHRGISCVSRRSGLRCTNRAHHGFVLARTRWRVF
jgi:kumamolisin